ncbi:MAG: hypothetical protein AAF499_18190 [Pseudomonadota bacterium]
MSAQPLVCGGALLKSLVGLLTHGTRWRIEDGFDARVLRENVVSARHTRWVENAVFPHCDPVDLDSR